MDIGVVLLRIAIGVGVGAGCATAGPVRVAGPGVALVEWQFPLEADADGLRAHPHQRALTEDPHHAAMRPAFFPALSDENQSETAHMMNKLTRHARQVSQSFGAGRESSMPPFLLNISAVLPDALEHLIAHEAVRILSFSSGSKSRLAGLDALLVAHPEVVLVAATPHISGNHDSVELLAERPSILAARGVPNVVLAGCLAFYEDGVEADRAGQPLGSRDNPFSIDNQPVQVEAPQVFMMNCRSGASFAPGAGATSAAAPHLANLLALIGERLAARGAPPTAGEMLAGLAAVTHRAWAREKTGEVHEVRYFTLDTILVNAGRPLVTEAIWGVFEAHPAPLRIAP